MDMDSGIGSLVKLFCIFVSLLYIKFQARQNDHDMLKSHVSLLDIKSRICLSSQKKKKSKNSQKLSI